MIESKEIKDILYSLGADLCEIASIDRFKNARFSHYAFLGGRKHVKLII